jgi:cytidylate kinase
MSSHALIVAIDGPSGAGKGTVARAVASRYGVRHIDTGAMYRAVAWKALHDEIDLHDESAVAAVARQAQFDLGDRVRIDGHDVTEAIRTPEIDRAAAIVARHPPVRAALVDLQRRFGVSGGVVMEGRDIGSVVFPNADVKIYLDASPEERARRRASDPAHTAGRTTSAAEAVARALEERDRSDRTRETSPLTLAEGAIHIDTTNRPIEDVVRVVSEMIDDRLARTTQKKVGSLKSEV